MSGSIPAPNPFTPPRSNLLQSSLHQPAPSIEEALDRGYDFSIGGLLGEARRNAGSIRWPVLAGFLTLLVALLVATIVLFALLAAADLNQFSDMSGQLLSSLVIGAFTYPFLAGILMAGIRSAVQQPVSIASAFRHFGHTLALVGTGILVSLLTHLGSLLLLLPGIYLSVAYLLAAPLVVERGLSPWQAMEVSRKAITQHWFKVFGLLTLLMLLLLTSALPLGIGLAWSLPLSAAAIGVLYREIFGVLPSAE